MSLRKVFQSPTYTTDTRSAYGAGKELMFRVYRNAEWDTYVTRFYVDGVLYEPADSEDDKDGCIATGWHVLGMNGYLPTL